MPEIYYTYVAKTNGDPKLVYFDKHLQMFTDEPMICSVSGFLSIRHPLFIDVTGQEQFRIPQIPDECDGIIFKGIGGNDSCAYKVRNDEKQFLLIPDDQPVFDEDINFASLLVFSANWCRPSKLFIDEIEKSGITNYTLIDIDKFSEYGEIFKIKNIPTTILVDASGEIIKKWVGYDDKDPGQTKLVDFIKQGKYYLQPCLLPLKQEQKRNTDITDVLPF